MINQDISAIIRQIDDIYCGDCDLKKECRKDYNFDCATNQLMNKIYNLDFNVEENEDEGCFICEDEKDIFYMDDRGSLKIAKYCPNCGRKID